MSKIVTAIKALVGREPVHAVYCDVIDQQSCGWGLGCKFHYQCWYSPGQIAYSYWGSCQPLVIC
ncbi:hypothetical protein FXF51_26005 [Nonomuraea sp. PA05]|uniref:hypothetical protein n=1 Tax=Nonomuraea sp. PA05 TaxID=2604466 RepID=UPI0011D6A2A3|nr:hypothetical protein [Nonomuraea sp. PA05]TYB62179.1 hypothetical protein FXF51_26005 [Nonomuraea sp. PA05]